ncbi:MAG: RNA polymerase sigma factor [Isosphaeraceae bacterium]
MATLGRGIVLRQMDRLFRDGTLTGLGDGQLLERYLTSRDEEAFEALVDQHGPMVLGLCRRMLHDPRDIEDAFQATFLVLVQKAPGIRDGNLLSNWLYGVAYRVARRARSRALRRRDRETAVGEPEAAASSEPDLAERTEWEAMLDQELSRMPEKYRAPLVLCYLRGRTHDQAAEELRCPVGTVRSRLARGRDLLRARLTRRGMAPTVMAVVLGSDTTFPARLLVAIVPPPLAAATVRAAFGFGSSSFLKAGASALVLAQGVLTTMKIAQYKWLGLATMATGLSIGGIVAVGSAAGQQQGNVGLRPAAPSVPGTSATGTVDPTERDLRRLASQNESRLKALEEKIDRLTDRLRTTTSAGIGDATQPKKPDDPFAADGGDRATARSGMTAPLGELKTQLQLAIAEYRRLSAHAMRGIVGQNVVEQARGKVLVLAARVQGLDQDYEEEMERLHLELRRKAAQSEKAGAMVDVAKAAVMRSERLNDRNQRIFGLEDQRKAQAELAAAKADQAISQVDVEEVGLRIRHLHRRQGRIRELSSLVSELKLDAGEGARSPNRQ